MFPGGNNNVISVLFKYVSDSQGKEKVQKDIQEIQRSANSATQAASISNAATPYVVGGNSAAKLAELNAQFARMKDLGPAALKEFQSRLPGLTKSFTELGDEIEGAYSKADKAAQQAVLGSLHLEQQNRMTARGTLYLVQGLQQVAQMATIAGGAITAGILKSANDYIKSGVEVNTTTREWRSTSNELADEQLRIGRVMADTVLPAYKQLDVFVGRLASFLEQHPAAAQGAALAGAGLLVGGTLATLVLQGVRIYADLSFSAATFAYVNAQREQAGTTAEFVGGVAGFERAVQQFLLGAGQVQAAAEINAAGGVGGKEYLPGAAGSVAASRAAAGGTSLLTVGGSALTFLNINKIGDAFESMLVRIGLVSDETARKVNKNSQDMLSGIWNFLTSGQAGTNARMGIFDLYASSVQSRVGPQTTGRGGTVPGITQEEADNAKQAALAFLGLDDAVKQTGQDAQAASSDYGMSLEQRTQFTAAALDNYINYQRQEEKATEQYQKQIVELRRDEGRQEADAVKRTTAAILQIQQQLAEQLAGMDADFALQEQRAYEDYVNRRSEIIRNSNQEELRAKQELELRLKQLEQDHNDRLYDLESSRDALGIVNENRRYKEQVANEKEQAALQAKERKQQLKQQLADLDAQYALEEARRQEDYQLRRQEAIENAAKEEAQRKADLAQQLQDMQDAEKQKEDDLAKSYEDQRNARLKDFNRQIIDLYEQFDKEAKMSDGWYQYMYGQFENFMKSLASTIPPGTLNNPYAPPGGGGGGGGTPKHDYSGYAYTGMYAMAQNGMPEYVLSGQATRVLEQMLGGKVSERALLASVAGGGARASITWNDHRRFDGDVSASVRRATREDTLHILDEVI